MNTDQMKRYEMLVRVNQFGEDHGELFPKASQGKQHFADVAAAVKRLSGYAVSKMRAEEEGKSKKTALRNTVRRRLRAMSVTAKLVAPDHPGMEDKFIYPDPQGDQALVTAGRMFAEDAPAFSSAFVAQGMPRTFIADLKELIDEFDQAIQARDAGKTAHAQARLDIAAALRSGTMAARKLDAMVANHLQANPLVIELWRRQRASGRPRRARTQEQEPTPAPASQPVPASPEPSPASPASVVTDATKSDTKVA